MSEHVESRLPMAASTWRLRDLAAVIGLAAVLQLAALTVLHVLDLPTRSPRLPTSGGEVVRQTAGSAAMIAAVILVARRRGEVKALVPLQVPGRKWVRWTIGISSVLLVAKAAVVASLPSAAPGVPLSVLLGGVFSVGVMTAIEEELLYRGVLYGWLSSLMRPTVAGVFSAGVFAMMHAGLAPGSAVSAFIFGLLFAWLYRRSSSLLPGVVIHAMNNALTLGVLALL